MTKPMTAKRIALKDLQLHKKNVRAKSPDTYAPENIAHLKASIATVGLIQPLVVAKLDKGYGVLAGGRRLASLEALVKAPKQDTKDHAFTFTKDSEIDCRVVPADCDLTTAISLAENITQAPMSAIDEFEAFAALAEVKGQTVETIAHAFGTTIASVKERLRYGAVHADIRAAVRAKDLSLDAMKAFAGHPAQDAQLEIYKALSAEDGHIGAWQVKRAIAERGIQASDALGALVFEAYEKAGGPIAGNLLDDMKILEDMDLVNQLLEERLKAVAEEVRKDDGFAWADVMVQHDWQAFHDYGRIYPGPVELDEAGQARVEAISVELTALEEKLEDESISDKDYDALEEKIEALTDEADNLQNAYKPEDLERAGVIVSWNNGITISKGLVRPEDRTDGRGKAASKAEDVDPSVITYAASLEADLKTERGMALGAALASAPEVATDLALFKLVCDVLLSGSSVTSAFEMRASTQYPTHAKIDEMDDTANGMMSQSFDALNIDWINEDHSSVQMFAGFRALDPSEKAKLVAYAVGKTTQPCLARSGHTEQLMGAIEAEVMPNVRDFWKPNAAFFGRLKKAQLLGILTDLGLSEEALNLSGRKKADCVDFFDELFADPFATLSADQRAAVEAWCPPGMQTEEVKVLTMTDKAKTKAKGKKASAKAA